MSRETTTVDEVPPLFASKAEAVRSAQDAVLKLSLYSGLLALAGAVLAVARVRAKR